MRKQHSFTVSLFCALVFSVLLFSACDGLPPPGYLARGPAFMEPSPPTETPGPGCASLRVLTFNTFTIPFHDYREERAIESANQIALEAVDIVALQEVWHEDESELFLDVLDNAGFSYQASHSTDAPLAIASAGLVLASRFPILESHFVPFESAAAPAWVWPPDWYASKGVLSVLVEAPAGNVWVHNSHIHADYEPGANLEERVAQSLELSAVVNAHVELPAIVLGDFNSQLHEVSHRALVNASGAHVVGRDDVDLIMARSGTHASLIGESAQPALVNPVTIDGVRTRLSDHAGVEASLRYCREEADAPARSVSEDTLHLLEEAAANASLLGERARSALGMLGFLLAVLLGACAKQRRMSRYRVTGALWLLWAMTWLVYTAYLSAPHQFRTYDSVRARIASDSN